MILVGNSPFSGASLIENYAANSVERQVLTTMRDSGAMYKFDNMGQLEFELNLRRKIVDAAILLNRSSMAFSIFLRTKCNEEFWKREANGGFRLKKNSNPAEAIRDIYNNGRAYSTECATAMMIVYYKAMLEMYGEEQFNKLFPSIYLMNWHTSDPLLRAVNTPKPAPEILLGDRCYISNPDVDPQTPHWQGENLIALPNNLYYGHGIGVTTADRVIQSLNGNRKPGATQSAHLMSTVGRPDFVKLEKQYKRKKDTIRQAIPVYDFAIR